MKNKERKQFQKKFAKENIDHFYSLLEQRFFPDYDHLYIQQILHISKSFNIRLSRNEKLKFCKKCFSYWNSSSLKIRANPKLKAKEYLCKNCGYIRRFRYK